MKKLKVKNAIKAFLVMFIGIFNPNYRLNINDLTHDEFNIAFALNLILLLSLVFILIWIAFSI